jgi:hypothetical protein
VPVIVTAALTAPEAGLSAVILGNTVNVLPLLGAPLTVTTTLPVVAPVGALTLMELAPQLVIDVAVVPLNVTVLVPCVEPKLLPVIVTNVPTAPEVGDNPVMAGLGMTVNATLLLSTPFACTITFPVVAPAGTGTAIEVPLQVDGVATVPLNVTVLVPWVAPKLLPAMVAAVPTAPELGVTVFMLGGGSTVNGCPLLGTPFIVTTTLPVVAPAGTGTAIDVALQAVGDATTPLKEIVLVP